MIGRITHVTLLVDEIDRALSFYIDVLGFEKRADIANPNGFRYVTVAPHGGEGPELWLLPATTEQQEARIGNQTDDVTLIVSSSDCRADFDRLSEAGVVFHGEPEEVAWGLEVVFEDLYGNRFVMVQARHGAGGG
jgi:catechol 2,3-dioxygenase-like lactoylglutathione lyase family enzyme